MKPGVLEVTVRNGVVGLPVHVQPGASKDKVRGVFDGALKLSIKAPPVDGAANERCRRFLARQLLNCSTSQVVLEQGARSRRKRFRIEDVPVETVRARLVEHLAACGVSAEVAVSEER